MPMKYYSLRLSSDPKVIGVKQGEAQAEIVQEKFLNQKNYDHYVDFAFPQVSREDAWKSYGSFPEKDISLEHIKLRKDAIATDFLSYADHLRGGGEFILSEKAINVITQFALPAYRMYPVRLFEDQNEINGYKLFYCPVLGYDMIDFSKTVFFRGSHILGKKRFTLDSKEEFINEKVSSPLFQCDQLALNKHFLNENLDLFNTILSVDTFVSERLAWAIKEAKLTGINVLEPQDPIIKISTLAEESL